MISFIYSEQAKKSFYSLDKNIQQRIREKISQLNNHPDIFSILKPMHGSKSATHRLRVGNYRLILRMASEHEFDVIDIGHRREIYR